MESEAEFASPEAGLGKSKLTPKPGLFPEIPYELTSKWELAFGAGKLTAREVFTLATVYGLVAANPEGGFAEALVTMLQS